MLVKTTVDVRTTPPPQRHPLIFRTWEALRPGEAFLLVNDHDPKPLYYQFKFEQEGKFSCNNLVTFSSRCWSMTAPTFP